MQGPVKPNEVGTANTLVTGPHEIQGNVNTVLGSPTGIQLFAGPRDDPFFIDLEAFFRILPDRKPESGPLSEITQGPLTFRPAGTAVDFLRRFNDLAIVVELPLADAQRLGVVSPENWAPPKKPPITFEPRKEDVEMEMRQQFAANPSVINTIERGPIDLRTGLPPGQIAPLPTPDEVETDSR